MLTAQLLLQLIIILGTVQLAGYLCQRLGQQWVIGEIIAGLVLGPSFLGFFWPDLQILLFPTPVLPTLQSLGDLGLILYLFSLGSRTDTHLMLRQGSRAMIVSLSGILVPLIMGVALAFLLYPDFAGAQATPFSFIFLIGTSMAITAFPVLARLLAEKDLLKTRIGALALTCAAVDDIVAWCLLAVVVALVQTRNLLSVLITVGLMMAFIMLMFGVVRPLLAFINKHIASKRGLFALHLILLFLSAYTTNAIGIHPVFGAFLMGVILPRRAVIMEQIQSLDQANNLLFLPLFFIYSGLRTHIGIVSSPILGLICLLILFIACAGKFSGAFIPLRLMGEPWRDAFCLGVLMNTRGLVELIVLNIGLDLGVLSPALFTMLVIMALSTTLIASPFLSLLRSRTEEQEEQPAELIV